MIKLRIRSVDAKHVRISGIEPYLAGCLQGLNEILEKRDLPKVRERLFPKLTTDNDNANADWQRLTAPELRHLFVSAGEVVARDLTALQPESQNTGCSQVTFAVDHVNAWMSALNQARLILGEIHEIDEADMNHTDLDPHNPKHVAAFQIHLLGHLLHLFVESETNR